MNFTTMLAHGPKIKTAAPRMYPAVVAYKTRIMSAAQGKILKVLRGKQMTAREILEATSHKSISRLCQYLRDMEGRDLIEPAGYTPPTGRGRPKLLWRIEA